MKPNVRQEMVKAMVGKPIGQVIIDALAVAQAAGKVQAPPPVKKEESKFRNPAMFVQGRTAMPGEARELANSEGFKERCALAGIPATRRQAAKFIQKRGALWNHWRNK